MTSKSLSLLLVTLVAAGTARCAKTHSAAVQQPIPAAAPTTSLSASRQELEERAVRLQHSGDADSIKEAAAIRTRLAEGDFNHGDRILLLVDGEKELSDTFTVGSERELVLPGVGEVPLRGVLRAELEPYLTRRLGESLRDPIVRARPLVRLSVQGAVTHPGFYGVPPAALLSDPLMAAGGTGPDANMDGLRIERAGHVILQGQELRDAIEQGRTIDEVGLMTGDQYVLPTHRHIHMTEIVAALGIPITIYELTRIF